MSSEEKLIIKPLYNYGQFKVCELCSSKEEETKPKTSDVKEEIKINIRGPRKYRTGGKLNINKV